ncbi:MAG: cupin domain-containing protein [Arenimonas sp.]
MTESASRPAPIINLADVPMVPHPRTPPDALQDRYGGTFGRIGERIGARQLGYNVTSVPPGKRAFPFHSHRVNEEMFFVLDGTGELRLGTQVFPLRAGDVVACPAGDADTAHQITNTGTGELRYLAVSTQVFPEICDYPDSGKFGTYLYPVGGDPREPFRFLSRASDGLDYWDGE